MKSRQKSAAPSKRPKYAAGPTGSRPRTRLAGAGPAGRPADNTRGSLVLRWQEFVFGARPDDWADAEFRVLVTGLEELDISTKGSVLDEWSARADDESMPALVRLQLRAAGRYWPDLILTVPR